MKKLYIFILLLFFITIRVSFAQNDTITPNTYNICIPDNITFTLNNTAPVPPNGYAWDLGNGVIIGSTSNVFTYPYSTPGNYQVNVHVNNTSGPGLPTLGALIGQVFPATVGGSSLINANLKPSFTITQVEGSVCAGQRLSTVSFTNVVGASPYTLSWAYGDGSLQNITTPSPLPATNSHLFQLNANAVVGTEFTSNVKVIDANGCFATEFYITRVSAKLDQSLIQTNYLACQVPVTFNYDASGLVSGTNTGAFNLLNTYWLFGSGLPAPLQVFSFTETKTITTQNNYVSYFKTEDDWGCRDSIPVITSTTVPTISAINLPNKICLGTAINVWDNFVASNKTTVAFDMGDGSSGLSFSPTLKEYIYATGGTFIITATAFTNSSCPLVIKTDTINVIQMDLDFKINPSYVCQMNVNQAVPFEIINLSKYNSNIDSSLVSPLNIATYEWVFRDSLRYRNPTNPPSPWGALVPNPVAPLPPLVTVYTADYLLKHRSWPFAIDSPFAKTKIYTSNLAQKPNFTITYKDRNVFASHGYKGNQHGYLHGSYKLKVTTPEGCVDSIIKPFMDTLDLVESFFTMDLPNRTNFCAPQTIQFKDSSISGWAIPKVIPPGGGLPKNPLAVNQWLWDFGDGDTSKAQNPTHTYTNAGIYNVKLIATNPLGCTDTSYFIQVKVGALPDIEFLKVNDLSGTTASNITLTNTTKNLILQDTVNFTLGTGVTTLDTENITYSLYTNSLINKFNPPMYGDLTQNGQCITYDFNTPIDSFSINQFASPLIPILKVCHRGCCVDRAPTINGLAAGAPQVLNALNPQLEIMSFSDFTNNPQHEKDTTIHQNACRWNTYNTENNLTGDYYASNELQDSAYSDRRKLRFELKLYGPNTGTRTIVANFGDASPPQTFNTTASSFEITHTYVSAGDFTCTFSLTIGTLTTTETVVAKPRFLKLKLELENPSQKAFCITDPVADQTVGFNVKFEGATIGGPTPDFDSKLKILVNDVDSINGAINTQIRYLGSVVPTPDFEIAFSGIGTQKVTAILRDDVGCEIMVKKQLRLIGIFPDFKPRDNVKQGEDYTLCPVDTGYIIDNFSKTNKGLSINTIKWNFGIMRINNDANALSPPPCNLAFFYDSLGFLTPPCGPVTSPSVMTPLNPPFFTGPGARLYNTIDTILMTNPTYVNQIVNETYFNPITGTTQTIAVTKKVLIGFGPILTPARQVTTPAFYNLNAANSVNNDSLRYIKFDFNEVQNKIPATSWYQRRAWLGVLLTNSFGCIKSDTITFVVPEPNELPLRIRANKNAVCWDSPITFNLEPAFNKTPAGLAGKTPNFYKVYWKFDDKRKVYQNTRKNYNLVTDYKSFTHTYQPKQVDTSQNQLMNFPLPGGGTYLNDTIYAKEFPYRRDLLSSIFQPMVVVEDSFKCKSFRYINKVLNPNNGFLAGGTGPLTRSVYVYDQPALKVKSIPEPTNLDPITGKPLYPDTICYNTASSYTFEADTAYVGPTYLPTSSSPTRLAYDFYFSKGNPPGVNYNLSIPSVINPALQQKSTNYFKTDVGLQYVKVGARVQFGADLKVCPVKFDSIPIFVTGLESDFKIAPADTIICINETVTLDSTNWFNVKSWKWVFGDGKADSSSANVSVQNTYSSYINTGVFQATLQAFADGGKCPETTVNEIYLAGSIPDFNRNNEVGSIALLSDTAHCLGVIDSLRNTSVAILNNGTLLFNFDYVWNFGNGKPSVFTSSINPVTVNYASPGVYDIQLITKYDPENCRDTVSKKIVVYPNPNVDVTVNDTCYDNNIGTSRPINLQASGVGAGSTYQWSITDGQIIPIATTDSFATLILNNPFPTQTFQVIATDKNGCRDTNAIVGNIAFIPSNPIYAIDTIYYGQSINIGDSSVFPGNPLNYVFEWSNPTNLSCIDCPKTTANPLADQIYILTIKDKFGCFVVKDTFEIYVNPLSTMDVPTAFTPNADGTNDIVYVRGIAIKNLVNFKIFNRYGELVFETGDINQGWDGYYKGFLQPSETYVYQAEVETYNPDPTKKFVLKKGTIKLLR